MIIHNGQLVRIGSVLDCMTKTEKYGIIISCVYGFGITSSEWEVFMEGKLLRIDETQIWPIEEDNEIQRKI